MTRRERAGGWWRIPINYLIMERDRVKWRSTASNSRRLLLLCLRHHFLFLARRGENEFPSMQFLALCSIYQRKASLNEGNNILIHSKLSKNDCLSITLIIDTIFSIFNARPIPSLLASLDLHGSMRKGGACQLGFSALHAVHKNFSLLQIDPGPGLPANAFLFQVQLMSSKLIRAIPIFEDRDRAYRLNDRKELLGQLPASARYNRAQFKRSTKPKPRSPIHVDPPQVRAFYEHKGPGCD